MAKTIQEKYKELKDNANITSSWGNGKEGLQMTDITAVAQFNTATKEIHVNDLLAHIPILNPQMTKERAIMHEIGHSIDPDIQNAKTREKFANDFTKLIRNPDKFTRDNPKRAAEIRKILYR